MSTCRSANYVGLRQACSLSEGPHLALLGAPLSQLVLLFILHLTQGSSICFIVVIFLAMPLHSGLTS